MNLFSLLGGVIWDLMPNFIKAPIMFIGNWLQILGQLIVQLLRAVLSLIYQLFKGICFLVDFAETVFKKVAGLEPIYLDGKEYGGSGTGEDLVYGFITNEAVMDVFWSIIALSVVLLFIFTIVAMIKSEFTLDLKGAAKGPIIGRAFKSFVNLIAVPAVSIVAIFATNFLTKTIYQLFDDNGTTLSAKCFQIAAYSANRVRIDNDFYEYINSNEWVDGGSSPFSGSQEAMAETIDKYFMEGLNPNVTFKDFGWYEKAERDDDENDKKYIDWFTMVLGYPKPNDPCSRADVQMVNYFYEFTNFQFILGIGSAAAIAWIMLTVCLVLLKRVFELTILFLLAPPMTAIAPLDGGQAEKKWRQEFMKRLLSVIGTVFAYNMYFLLVPIFETISIFGSSAGGSGVVSATGSNLLLANPLDLLGGAVSTVMAVIFDLFFQIICVITGMSIVKSASALISNLLGIEDLVKSGGEAAKKALETGKKAVALTAAGGVLGGRVVGTAAKIVGKTVGRTKAGQAIASGAKNLLNKAKFVGNNAGVSTAQSAYDKASDDVEAAQKEYDSYNDEILKVQSRKHKENETDEEREAREAAEEAEITEIKKKQQKAGDKLKQKQKAKDAAGIALDHAKAGTLIGRAKDFVTNSTEAKDAAREASEKITKAGEAELAPYDKDSAYYKKRKAEIDAEAEKAAMEASGNVRKASIAGVVANSPVAGFAKIVGESFSEQWGKDSGDTSVLGSMSKKLEEATKNIPFIRSATKTMHDLLGASASDVLRRWNDALSGLAGDAGDLVKFAYNPNARASWFESVPEDKKRKARIDNNLTMEARKNFEKSEASKAEKAKEQEAARRMITEERAARGDADAMRLSNIYKQLQAGGLSNPEKEKLKIEAAELEVKGGMNSIKRAGDRYVDEASGDSDKLQRLKRYKEMMQQEAATAAYKDEKASKERATLAASANGDTPETKITEQSSDQLAKAIANALHGGKGLKLDGNQKVRIEAEDLRNGIEGIGESIKQLAEQLRALSGGSSGGGGGNPPNPPSGGSGRPGG